jgi:hypothetical protein
MEGKDFKVKSTVNCACKSSHYGSVYSIDTLETMEVSSDGGVLQGIPLHRI